jgi:PAS domain S-box-containing protein
MTPHVEPSAALTDARGAGAVIALVGADPALAAAVLTALQDDGHTVSHVQDLPALLAAPPAEVPAAVFLDPAAIAPALAGRCAAWAAERGVPLAVLGDADSAAQRRQAEAWDARLFVGWPCDAAMLQRAASALQREAASEPCRLLMVGPPDAPLRAALAGPVLRWIEDPDAVFAAAREVRPDVIVFLPGADRARSAEIQALMRRDVAFDDVMLLAVLAHAEDARALPHVTGALIAPVTPAQLRQAVQERALRRRRLDLAQQRLDAALAQRRQERLGLDAHALVSITDARGRIVYANDKFCHVSGYARPALLGATHRIVKSGLHPAAFYRDMWQTIAAGRVWQGEVCNRRHDGSLYWVASTIVPLCDAQGRPRQYVSIRTDITAAKAEQQLLRLRSRQQHVLGALAARWLAADAERVEPLASISLRLSGRLVAAERGSLVLRSADGETFSSVAEWCAPGIPPLPPQVQPWPLAAAAWLWERLAAGHSVVLPDLQSLPPEAAAYRARLQGQRVCSLLAVPLRSAAGTFGFVCYETVTCAAAWPSRDVAFAHALAGLIGNAIARTGAEADLRAQRRELARHVELLEQVGRLAEVGGWEIEAATGTLAWTPQTYRLHGRDPALPVTLEMALKHFPPSVRPAFEQALQGALQDGTPFDLELPLQTLSGREIWVRALGRARRSGQRVTRVVGAVQEISARKQAELAMRQAKELAERASQAKSDFLSTMSHELRTPMNAILGFGQLLEIELAAGGRQHGFVQEILKGGQHLLALIDDVLDLARIDSGRIQLSLETVDLRELTAHCLRMTAPLSERRHLRVDASELTALPVRADRVRLRQVLMNLLSNAIKYNVDHGAIVVTALPVHGDRVRVAVRDTGPGIAPERQAELFQPFNRLGAEAGPIEGTGIGLTIVRRLVELMDGRVGFESTPGAGSCFWFELRRAEPGALHVPSPSESLFAALPHPGARQVLYIDDNPSNLRLVAQVLARWPALELLTAQDPRLGLDLAAAHRPDLVLLDIQMAPLDGYAVLARLRADPALASVPVVAITANVMPRDLARLHAAGFDECLTKPFDVRRLLQAVTRHLRLADGQGAA